MKTTTLIATPQTDKKIYKDYRKLGKNAHMMGVKRDSCPYNGQLKTAWLEGWDSHKER